MIHVTTAAGTTVSLTIADRQVDPRFAFDLGSLLFLPQTQLPGAHLYEPPARPPFRYEFAPGTLYWPQGASRFALGQYVVTSAEAVALRLAIGGGFSSNTAVTLTLDTPHTADEILSFRMHVLHLIPLQYQYAPLVTGAYPPDVDEAIYLLLLVDYRYFFQLPPGGAAPAIWSVDEGTTTWTDLDDDIVAWCDHGFNHAPSYDYDVVHADYDLAYPSRYLGSLALASEGVVCNYGHLLDAIGTATGRRFVTNRDGTFYMQDATTAREAHQASEILWLDERRHGGDLSFPAVVYHGSGGHRDTRMFPAFVVPFGIDLVFPTQTGGGVETNRTKLNAAYDDANIAAEIAWYNAVGEDDVGGQPIYEGTLNVQTTYWIQSGDTTDAQTLTERFAIDWYNWLAQPEITCYTGVVPFEPDGFCDSILWVTRKDDVCTWVVRGPLNPRPGVVLWYSGLDEPAGPQGTVTSVALTAPSILTVSGSPVTTSGTLALALANQTANRIFAGPSTGSPAVPTFRALVAADLPAGIGTVTSVALTVPSFLSVAGSPITTSGTLAVTLGVQSARTFFAGPTSGGSAVPFFRSIFTDDLPDDGVTFAKMQNLTANRLLGRQPTSGGDPQEITLGTGLTLTATTLDVTLALTDLTDFSFQTLAAYSADDESAAYTADPVDLADLNALRAAYENLRAAVEDLRTKLQAAGLVG